MNTFQKCKTHLLLLLIIMASVDVYGQVAKAEKELEQMMKDMKVVGLSVAVVKDGAIIYNNAFGLKNIAQNTKLSTDDTFRIASISKSFCAIAIMQLIEAKKLKLTDNVSDLVGFKVVNPNFPDEVITLKMLLNHTSSINDTAGWGTLNGIDPAKNKGNNKCYSNYKPGTGYKYCNTNFTLLGVVIERASGLRFDNYIKQNIVELLGLQAGYNVDSLDQSKFTSLYEYNTKTDTFTEAPIAYKRSKTWDNYQLGYSAYSFAPTAGMKISAPDLAKYMMMLMNDGKYQNVRIMSKKSAKLMKKPTVEVSDEEGYAFAIRNIKSPRIIDGNLLVGHTGSLTGLYSAMLYNPKGKYGFVVISSGSLPDNNEGPSRIRKVLAEGMNILHKNFIK